MVRKYLAEMSLNDAVNTAVDECIRNGILAEFLRKNRAEVVRVSIFEYDKEIEDEKLRQAEFAAGRTEGRIEGRNIERRMHIREMLLDNVPINKIKQYTKATEEEILSEQEKIKEN